MGENDAVKRQGKLYGKRASTSLDVVKYETYLSEYGGCNTTRDVFILRLYTCAAAT